MYRVLLAFAMLLATSAIFPPAYANEVTADKGFAESAPVYGVTYTEERVIQLPQDQNKCYLSLIGDPNDAKFAQVQSWFANNERLGQIKNQTHYNVYAKGSTMYAERYSKTTDTRTTVRLQDADGNVVYEKRGNDIPMTAEALSRSISTECIFKRWRQNRQERRNPQQEAAPDNNSIIDGDQEAQPLDSPPVEPEDEGMNLLLLGLAGMGGLFVGGAVGAGKGYKAQHYASAG